MVLVPVGEDDRLDVVQPVPDVAEVGQDQVDAGLLVVGEQHAAVDDQQLAVVLEHGHVAADLPETSERDDAQAVLGQLGWQAELDVGMRRGVAHAMAPVRAELRHMSTPEAVMAAAMAATSCSVASTRGARTGPPGSPSSPRAALAMMTPWVVKNSLYEGNSRL